MTGRISALDVLRGVAILGTLGTNVWIFASPDGPASFLTGGGSVGEALLRAVSNGKFLGLLSILFGIGVALQHRSAVRRGERWPGWYLWRSALLLVEGLLHYTLLFEFDVLMYYAVVSVGVAYVVGRGARSVRRWMVGALVAHLVVVGVLTAALAVFSGDVGGASGLPTDTSSWVAQVVGRWEHFAVYRVEAVLAIPLSAVLFLAGALLLDEGALEDSERGRRVRRRLMWVGLGAGAPLNLGTTLVGGALPLVDRYVCAPVVAFGLLGLVVELVLRGRAEAGRVRRGITAVGRSALSCYIGQNLIASVLCYDWGFGLAGRYAHLGVPFVVGVWVVVSGVLVVCASWWMARFERGPVEELWNRAHRGPQRLLTGR
ncbi:MULTISPECIES: DUF418 domain-containing protein [Actinosynnema]|uniref:DUF418 domain-containing protein n=1 Tax=Actinosynnema TaxID=40566 RepID=UPI0020A2B9F4|nr:DUF418 domain-containing protein [Actinosynnema pretiosum]MCP2095655.1 uncharacterized protein [Actinosynnema pretiosum]